MKTWACDNFKTSNDPYFCANCGDFASMHNGPTPGAPRCFRRAGPVMPEASDKLVDELTEKFLQWPLPASVCSDLIVTLPGEKHRVGTNLLSYDEARQMMEEVVITTLRQKGIHLRSTEDL
jgi:hypothetical protein